MGTGRTTGRAPRGAALAALAGVALVAAGGCRSRDATAVKYVGLSSDARPGTSLGLVTALDCATQVFGIGRSPHTLSVNGALERAQSERGLRYLNGVSIDLEATNVLMYDRTCIVVKGEGFR